MKKYAWNSTLPAPSSPLPKVNKERRARREAEGLVYSEHHHWIMRQPCELRDHPLHQCGTFPERHPIEGHHLKHVGNGGEDRANEIPCCPVGHDFLHSLGSVSAACDFYGRDFRSLAVEYTLRFERETQG